MQITSRSQGSPKVFALSFTKTWGRVWKGSVSFSYNKTNEMH